MSVVRIEGIALFILLVFSLAVTLYTTDDNITGFAPHATDSRFSAAHDVTHQQQGVTIKDSVIYKQAWYSINGSGWQSFTLQGTTYPNTDNWLVGTATHDNLPIAITQPGEHYLITYSCAQSNDAWNCHGGKWQLSVINIIPEDPEETCFDKIKNQDEIEIDCGGICDACPPEANCRDGILNQNEIETDCGGVCDACGITIYQQGFEVDSSPFVEMGDGDFAIDTGIAYTGSNSLHLTGHGGSLYTDPDIGQESVVADVQGGELFEYSVWARGDSDVDVGLTIMCLDDEYVYWNGESGYRGFEQPATNNWEKLSVTYICPDWASHISLRLTVRGSGDAWYDDATLTTKSVPSSWYCEPSYYGADNCDCGCGAIDPDCHGGGCADGNCYVDSCDYCFDAAGTYIGCPGEDTCEPDCSDLECGPSHNDCSSCGSCSDGRCISGVCQEVTPPSDGDYVVVFRNDFEHLPLESYSVPDDWDLFPGEGSRDGAATIIEDAPGNQVLSQFFAKDVKACTYNHYCFEASQDLRPGYDELYFSYKVKFDTGFKCLGACKMPSIRGLLSETVAGVCPSGYDNFHPLHQVKARDGGIHYSDYIYHSMMWDTPSYQDSYRATYDQNATSCDEMLLHKKGGVYGEGGDSYPSFYRGQWYEITQRVVLNDVGARNGFVETFVDGQFTSRVDELVLTRTEDLKINLLEFAMFFTGQPSPHNQSVYFDDITLYYFTESSDEPLLHEESGNDRVLPVLTFPEGLVK